MKVQKRASAATAMVLATLLYGCSEELQRSPITPTSPQNPLAGQTPAAQPPAAPGTLYTLSGLVFEVTSAGNRPIEGVEVYCEQCGPPLGHSGRFTDRNGAYSFDGAGGVAGPSSVELLVAKQGYILPRQPDQSGPSGLGWMGSVVVAVGGDTRYNIQIIRK
jgi:hypothetical protein